MGRKHFQDLANVMCSKFVDCPSNTDLVDLAILGDGVLELFITEGRAMHDRHAITPLAFASEWLLWAESRLEALRIPRTALHAATLRVQYTVTLERSPALSWLTARFRFGCLGLLMSVDREYRAELSAEKTWGLGQVSPAPPATIR